MVVLLATIFGRGTISVFNSPASSIRFSLYEFSSAILPADLSIALVVLAITLFIGVPLLAIIYAGIRHLFGIKQKNRIVKYTANALWLCGLGLIIYIGYTIGNDFAEESTVKQKIEITQPTSQVLYLDLKPLPDEELDVTYNHHHKVHIGNWSIVSKDENKFRLSYPSMDIIKSETDSFQVVLIKTADGYDKTDASHRAKNIDYLLTQKDSSILFNSYFDVYNTDKLRAQELKIILKVPLNKVIYLSKRMEKIIFDIHNVNDALDKDMVNRRWIMTDKDLECLDCDGLESMHKHKSDKVKKSSPRFEAADEANK